MAIEEKDSVKRIPVDYDFGALNPFFLKGLAKIAVLASGKYGSWSQYTQARLVGEKSPVNHAMDHLLHYALGDPYDAFDGSPVWHLFAAGYNIQMEVFYFMRYGHLKHPLTVDPSDCPNPAKDTP